MIMVILFIAIIIVNILDKEENELGSLPDITGAMQSYEVYHGTSNPQYISVKTPERYDDKFFGYLEHIKESRDKTFMRGRVFLIEK